MRGKGEKRKGHSQVQGSSSQTPPRIEILSDSSTDNSAKERFNWITGLKQENNNYCVAKIEIEKKDYYYIGCNRCKLYFCFTKAQLTTHNKSHKLEAAKIKFNEEERVNLQNVIKNLENVKRSLIKKIEGNQQQMKDVKYLKINENAGVFECELCKRNYFNFILKSTEPYLLQQHLDTEKHKNISTIGNVFKYGDEQNKIDAQMQKATIQLPLQQQQKLYEGKKRALTGVVIQEPDSKHRNFQNASSKKPVEYDYDDKDSSSSGNNESDEAGPTFKSPDLNL